MVAEMAEATAKEFGGINVVVANASALWWKSIEETPMPRYDLINQINARGAFACAHYCLPHMREAGWGHFVTQSPRESSASEFLVERERERERKREKEKERERERWRRREMEKERLHIAPTE